MGMLTQDDLKQIGALLVENNKVFKVEIQDEIVPEIVSQIVEQVGEMLEQNVLPQFDRIDVRLTKIETRLDTEMVTKDHLDERLGRVNGKLNVLIDVLHANGAITGDQRVIVQAA